MSLETEDDKRNDGLCRQTIKNRKESEREYGLGLE